MSILTIHYQSPAYDPLKVPRPHWVQFDKKSSIGETPKGGEIGALSVFIGMCPTVTPSAEYWRLVALEDLVQAKEQGTEEDFTGWYAQFIDADGIMFGYDMPIQRVEVEL